MNRLIRIFTLRKVWQILIQRKDEIKYLDSLVEMFLDFYQTKIVFHSLVQSLEHLPTCVMTLTALPTPVP